MLAGTEPKFSCEIITYSEARIVGHVVAEDHNAVVVVVDAELNALVQSKVLQKYRNSQQKLL